MRSIRSTIKKMLARCVRSLRTTQNAVPPASPEFLTSSSVRRIDWEQLFKDARFVEQAPQQVAEANKRMRQTMGDLHETVEGFARCQQRWVLRLIEVVDFCEGIDGSPEVEAVRSKLLQIVESTGVRPWSPSLGEPPPVGCEIQARSTKVPVQSEACLVVAVIRTGYRCANDSVLRRPLVMVDIVKRAPEFGQESEPGLAPQTQTHVESVTAPNEMAEGDSLPEEMTPNNPSHISSEEPDSSIDKRLPTMAEPLQDELADDDASASPNAKSKPQE